MTQAALGVRVGLSRTAITNIERGRQRLLVDQLVRIADALSTPTEKLLPRSSAPRRTPPANDRVITAMPTVKRWVESLTDSARLGD